MGVDSCLQMPALTDADWLGFVPARLAVSPHDAGEGRVSLQRVAAVAAVGDGGAQLELGARPRPIAHQARLEARLPGVLCGEEEKGNVAEKSVADRSVRCYSTGILSLLHHITMLQDFPSHPPRCSGSLVSSLGSDTHSFSFFG